MVIKTKSVYKNDVEKETILKRNMESDGIPTLKLIKRLYVATLKKHNKKDVNKPQEDENINEGSSGKSDMAKIIYFGFNYPHDFITKIWGEGRTSQHLKGKFNDYYEKAGSNGALFLFFVNLDSENQAKLEQYISSNYRG